MWLSNAKRVRCVFLVCSLSFCSFVLFFFSWHLRLFAGVLRFDDLRTFFVFRFHFNCGLADFVEARAGEKAAGNFFSDR